MKYYLSSLDSYKFGDVRECKFIEKIDSNKNGDIILVEINPCVVINNLKITKLYLTARYLGDSLLPINEFPLFVNILIPDKGNYTIKNIDFSNLSFIAIGELYETKEKALNHDFN